MTNLLPEIEKSKIRREYHIRLASVCLSFSLVVFLISIFFLLPSYFFSYTRERSVIKQLHSVNLNTNVDKRVELDPVFQLTDLKLAVLNETSKTSLEDLLRKINSSRPNGVRITQLTYNAQVDDVMGEITVVGEANLRDNLVRFTQNLRRESLFSNVDLPVSNLAQSHDVSFLIRIKGEF